MFVKFNSLTLLSFVFSLLMSWYALADTSGDVLYQQCTACHGVNGEGNEGLNAPTLAGQDAKYMLRQIKHYAKGVRAKAELAQPMVAMAKSLTSAADLAVLTAYIEKLPVKSVKNELLGDLKNGSRYYQAKCGACHGGTAQGNKSFNAPRLANQSTQYLLQQMKDFIAGKRGYAKEDKFGRQMAMMANTTQGQELTDILYYISVQPAK